jgi:hypothetical protein
MQSMLLLSAALATNVKVFAKSFRSCIRNDIIDAATKAFCVILSCGLDIADKRSFSSHQIKRTIDRMTD